MPLYIPIPGNVCADLFWSKLLPGDMVDPVKIATELIVPVVLATVLGLLHTKDLSKVGFMTRWLNFAASAWLL
jgi:hypothetical protein